MHLPSRVGLRYCHCHCDCHCHLSVKATGNYLVDRSWSREKTEHQISQAIKFCAGRHTHESCRRNHWIIIHNLLPYVMTSPPGRKACPSRLSLWRSHLSITFSQPTDSYSSLLLRGSPLLFSALRFLHPFLLLRETLRSPWLRRRHSSALPLPLMTEELARTEMQ